MVYDRVIQEVCEASQVDFEEGGVDQQTLEEMRTVGNPLFLSFLPSIRSAKSYVSAEGLSRAL